MRHKTVDQMSKDELVQLARYDSIVRNNGFDPETERNMSMQDAMDLPSAAIMIPRVLTQFVQEGVEPMLVGTSLLQRIEYQPGMQTVFPAIDTLSAREVGDGMALPVFNIHMAGGQSMGLTVKRHGLALRVNNRFVEQSTWPWMQYWMRLAGYALARHKEERIFGFINSLGAVAFDNAVAARKSNADSAGYKQPVLGHTTGRNLKGQYNGSTTMDDIFDMYAMILLQGYIPDTILMHPMSFLMWVKDPVMREFALAAGGGSFFGQFTGQVGKAYQGQYNWNGLGQGLGQTGQYSNGQLVGGQQATVEGLPQKQTTAPVIPGYMGIPFRIVVSPFVYFNPENKTTTFTMFDSKSLGCLIVDKDPHVISWDEPQYSIHNVGIEEAYGFAVVNEGQGIAVAKNVRVRSNEFVLPARAMFDIASSSTFEGEMFAAMAKASATTRPMSTRGKHLELRLPQRSEGRRLRPSVPFSFFVEGYRTYAERHCYVEIDRAAKLHRAVGLSEPGEGPPVSVRRILPLPPAAPFSRRTGARQPACDSPRPFGWALAGCDRAGGDPDPEFRLEPG